MRNNQENGRDAWPPHRAILNEAGKDRQIVLEKGKVDTKEITLIVNLFGFG